MRSLYFLAENRLIKKELMIAAEEKKLIIEGPNSEIVYHLEKTH